MEVSGLLNALVALIPRKTSLVPNGKEFGWVLEIVWRLHGKKKSSCPCWRNFIMRSENIFIY